MDSVEKVEKNAKYSAELREMLILRYEPIAIKMVENEQEIPKEAINPIRDLGKHMALCQAFAKTRRDMKTIYMDKRSEWCWAPLIGLGFVECREGTEAFDLVCQKLGFKDLDTARDFFARFPTLPLNKHIGIVSAPLVLSTYEPDLVLIYCNNAQLRSLLWAIKTATGNIVTTQLDAIDSCIYACVPPLQTGEYRVTLPDPGEYERAATDENEIILSVPGHRLDELVTGLRPFYEMGMGYPQLSREMLLDFPRPEFYNSLFKIWGLDQGQEWDRG